MTKPDKHTVWWWTMHYFERLKGVTWLMKVDNHGDQLNTQFPEMICIQVPCSKVMTNNYHYLQDDSPSHFPHHDRWVPLFSFMSWKRVTNTWYRLSEDKSSLICFLNLREEGFVPKTGLLMFNLTSPLKENLVSFMFRESERIRKKDPKGVLFRMI